jgi:hypothetical protein
VEHVTLERFYSDPQFMRRVYAQAHRERIEMMHRILGALLRRAFTKRARRAVATTEPARCA